MLKNPTICFKDAIKIYNGAIIYEIKFGLCLGNDTDSDFKFSFHLTIRNIFLKNKLKHPQYIRKGFA